MKKIICVFALLLVFAGCMKNYDDDVVIIEKNERPTIKITGASGNSDSAYAEPNIYLKFWLDELDQPNTNYSFAWNLGQGDYSSSASPEKKFNTGTYNISVTITPNGGGANIYREIVLVIRPGASNSTIKLHSATLMPDGSYSYGIAMKKSSIYDYQNISGNPWVQGDWTNWEKKALTESVEINGVSYMIDYVVRPANYQLADKFSFGRGQTYSYDPNSPFWSEGLYRGYMTNGQFSPSAIPFNSTPGESGDVANGANPPTIRNNIMHSNIAGSDSLTIFVNFQAYANGEHPFITRMLADNWVNIPLIKLTGEFTGWSYQRFKISDLNGGLYFRFGPNINSPNNLGNMTKSMYFLTEENMLALQLVGTNGNYKITQIE